MPNVNDLMQSILENLQILARLQETGGAEERAFTRHVDLDVLGDIDDLLGDMVGNIDDELFEKTGSAHR